MTAPIPETSIHPTTGELVLTYAAGDARHPSDRADVGAADLAELRSPIAAESAFQRNANQAAGDAVARQLDEQEGDARIIERTLLDADEHLDRIDRERNQAAATRTHAVEAGKVDLPAPVAIPSKASIVFWRLFELGTIGSESMCTLSAFLNTLGIDPGDLAGAWRTNAPTVAAWTLASVVIAAILFVIVEWSFATVRRVIEERQMPARSFRMMTASAALLSVLVAVIVIASLRAQLSAAGQASVMTTGMFAILGLLPLIGGALAHLHADTLIAARRDALLTAARPNAADVAVQLRSEHEEALIEQRNRLRARREIVMNEIQRLHAQMHGAEQVVRDNARHETRVVDVYFDSLRAALATDKKMFERFARAQNKTALLLPAEQPPMPQPPPTAVVPLRRRSAS